LYRRISVRPRFYVILIAIMLLCFGVSGLAAQLHYNRMEDRVTGLATQRLALSSRISELNSRLDYVRTDAYIMRVARDELNMVMPGEIRYISS